MSTSEAQHERRAACRFSSQHPLTVKTADGQEQVGVTRDISARGVCFYTELTLAEGSAIEVTVVLPSEVTLGESMKVRCQSKTVRVSGPAIGGKFEVAALIQRYEYLPDASERQEPARTTQESHSSSRAAD